MSNFSDIMVALIHINLNHVSKNKNKEKNK